jgi:NitT/TauT family transport system substrate-binding protein
MSMLVRNDGLMTKYIDNAERSTRRGWLRSAGAAASIAALPRIARAQSALTTVKASWTPSDLSSPGFYAKDLGYLREAGIDLQVAPNTSGAAVAAAVVSGSIEIGFSNLLALVVAYEKGIPFTMIASGNLAIAGPHPAIGLLSVKTNSPLNKAKDFEGKTVAVDSLGSFSVLGVRSWMDKNGADSRTVHFVELPYSAMPAAIVADRVDAGCLTYPADPTLGQPGDALRLVAGVYNVIAQRFLFTAWFSTSAWVAAHQDVTKRFATAIRRASAWGNSHQGDGATILAKYVGQTPTQINSAPRAIYGTELTPALVQPTIDLLAKYGTIHAAFPASEMIAKLT